MAGFMQWFWILVSAIKSRDVAHSTSLPPSLAPYLSPTAAVASMPKLLELRPWRHCSDTSDTMWALTANATLAPRDADASQAHAIASEAYTTPEWIMCTVPVKKGRRDTDAKQKMNVVYNVPYLEAWADVATGAADEYDLRKHARKLAREVQRVAEAASSGGMTRDIYGDGDTLIGMADTGSRNVAEMDRYYREALDVKPGTFELSPMKGGSLRLRCPDTVN